MKTRIYDKEEDRTTTEKQNEISNDTLRSFEKATAKQKIYPRKMEDDNVWQLSGWENRENVKPSTLERMLLYSKSTQLEEPGQYIQGDGGKEYRVSVE